MEAVTSEVLNPSIEPTIPQEGNTNPASIIDTNICAPPRKHKRATPSEIGSGCGRETSDIWNHFDKFVNKEKKKMATCNYCRNILAANSTNGTTSLWNHLRSTCRKSPYRIIDRKPPVTAYTFKKGKGEGVTGNSDRVVYNVNEVRRAIAEFVIIDEQPFRVVEGEGFKRLMLLILPNFALPSRITVARHCLRIYHDEKEKLKKVIKNQHVCLTSDTWTSIQNLTYMVVTAHWIDDDWILQKRILNFFQTPDHKGETISKGIEACMLDWGIENPLTVTLDNAFANDAAIRHLKGRIEDWNGIILNNEFLHVRCSAHVLNLIVKEGLSEQDGSISRVRNSVKYVKSSPSRLVSFKSFVEKVKIDSEGLLSLDVETRWNSTYMMLTAAIKFEKAFTRMLVDDSKYRLDMIGKGGHPTLDDWKKVKIFTKFLDIFYQLTLKFSGTLYVTSNCFFYEIFNLYNFIIQNSHGDDSILIEMAGKMKEKYEKYWGDFEEMNILFVAVVLDPRYKMKYVKFIFRKSYGSLMGTLRSNKVLDTLSRLYNHYKDFLPGTSNENLESQFGMIGEGDSVDMCQSQWEKFLEDEVSGGNKSELERYLADDVEKTKNLDILAWWKDASKRYPVVSRIARDVLAIPISTVASESAFSTGGRILDSYRSSLSPKIVEALICTQQWLRTAPKECNIEDILDEIQKLELVEKEYPDDVLSID